MMGPINGEINMAPMMTAVEFTLRPMEAITMLKTRIQTLNPRNSVSRSIPCMVCSGSAKSTMRRRSNTWGRNMVTVSVHHSMKPLLDAEV